MEVTSDKRDILGSYSIRRISYSEFCIKHDGFAITLSI